MSEGPDWNLVLKDGKIIITIFFVYSNFEVVIQSEVELQYLIDLPSELIVLYGSNQAEETSLFEKLLGHLLRIQF